MKSGYLLCIVLSCLVVGVSGSSLSVSEIQERGKVLFRALRDSECTIKCKSRKPRIMCGSDGVSYLSKCEVKRARRCEGKNVTIKKRGKCSDSDVPMTKCFQERQEATSADSRSNAKDVFIPSCKSDGTFSEIQCHKASGYCWCVSKEGKPLSGTSTKTSTPNCRGSLNSSKVVTRQRRRNEKRKRRVNIVHSAISGCSSLKRTRFNKNIVRVFTEEYKRSAQHFPKVSKNNLDPVIDTLDKKVVEWKFSQYDKDFDNQLSRIEVKSLRRLVKKFIKPRACAKSFLKYCDSDHNKYIERGEWSLCLGVDITMMTNATVKMIENYKDSDPNFTLSRQQEHHRQEQDQMEKLRKTISSRLKRSLPDNLSEALSDGVLLCHLANQIRPRSVASVHVPSPAVPKLTPAKCRRNVENFLEACRKIGVQRDQICNSSDILEEKSLLRVAATVAALVSLASNSKVGSMV